MRVELARILMASKRACRESLPKALTCQKDGHQFTALTGASAVAAARNVTMTGW